MYFFEKKEPLVLNFLPESVDALKLLKLPVIVTGAGGWLGQAALEMLDAALGDAFAGQVTAYGATARIARLRSGRGIAIHALADITKLSLQNALVFHFAFLTREHAGASDYISANRQISQSVQKFLKRNGAVGIFNPSSGAVYAGTEITENPYGALKREDEEIFADLATKLGFPACVMRVFNLAGPFINKLDSYALATIISDLLASRPVTLRAAHPVWRGYAHVADVINIGLGSLLNLAPPGVFDSAGEPIEIGDLALRAAQLLGRPADILRPGWQDGKADKYLGDALGFARQARLAGVTPCSLDRQILDTADYMRGLNLSRV